MAFTAIVEIGTGAVLLVAPAMLVSLLLGTDARADVLAMARFFGAALIALGVACWPGPAESPRVSGPC